MTDKVRVEWLPVGHIAHGYRRVFTILENGALRHVVNLVPMPYELVYQVKELSGETSVKDPALLWGLSVVYGLMKDGTLLGQTNPDTADDGYIQVRPTVPTKSDLIPISVYQTAIEQGALVVSD